MTISTYLLYSIVPLCLCLFAQWKVKNAFGKYSQIGSMRGCSGAEAARKMLDAHGLTDVRIEKIAGTLSDHYDPRSRVLRLSEGVYDAPSIASVSVACHEAGHAYQHAESYAPLVLRTSIIPVVNFGGRFGPIIFMIGLFLASLLNTNFGYNVAVIGLIIFAATAVFSLITLPVEFDASNRAKAWLEASGVLYGSELDGARDMLSAAAMTYVASAIQSLATVLYYASMLSGRRDRRNH